MVLGFPGFVAAILLIIYFFVRHLWRNEAAEEEDAIRLFNMSKQEAEVAALHSGAKFGSSPLKPYCVVCLSPTTTRCSQCKAVRYCSSNCQIIHWRQGHKDECQPPILLHGDLADSKDTHESFDSLSTPMSQFYISKTASSELEEFPVSVTEPWNSSSSYVSHRCSQDWNNNEAVFSEDEGKISSSFSGWNHHVLSNIGWHPIISSNDANINNTHALSELENVPRSPRLPNKGLKKLAMEVIKPFRKSDNPNPSYTGIRKDAAGEHKETLSNKLFVQLYSFKGLAGYPFGLINCGNSCYANAVLQCLAFARPITSYLVQGLHSRTCLKKDWCFLCEFESLILKGREGISPLNPIKILSEIQKIGNLSPGREEDAHEFLRFTIDTMQSICLEEAGVTDKLAKQSTLIDLTFGGYLKSKIKCMKCLGRSEQYDRIMDLTVEIDGDIETLDEALAQFTAYETLDGENKYWCSRCKSYEKARKRLTIHEAPNVLTIVLKRFQSGNLEKLNKFIRFTESLNLAPYMSRLRGRYLMYHLYAVIVHLDMMNVVNSGHYICYVKNFSGEWFRVDDTMVMATELEKVLFEKAYILLYTRDTPRPPSLVRNIGTSSDAKCTRDLEAVPKKEASITESPMLDQSSRRFSHSMIPNDSGNYHLLQSEPWRYQSVQGNPFMHPSDSSSYFTSSDATSSTDSTKDSGASDMSGYIFGSSLQSRSEFLAY